MLSRIIAVALWVYAVWWLRNVYVGIAVHVLLNVLGGGLVIAAIARRL